MARGINRTTANNGATLGFEKSQATDALRSNMDEENDLIDFGKEESDSMNRLLPYPSAEEERDLWKRYSKLRRIDEILGLKTIADKIPGVGRIFSEIVEDISKSVDLIALLKELSDLDRLGDKIIEDSNNTTATMIELYRLIQNSEGRSDNEAKSKSGNSCCLRDLFGFIFIEMLNNIAFGRGNPNLVDKVVKATNGDTFDIRTRIYRLAINRELLPKNIIKLIDPKTPVIKLPQLVRGILPEQFSKNVKQLAEEDAETLLLVMICSPETGPKMRNFFGM